MAMHEYKFCPVCAAVLVARELGGRMRMACARDGCGFVAWDNPVPVVAAIVERDATVILVHGRGRPPGWYGLVAGFLEKGEHPDEAVRREVAEELGLALESPRLIGTYAFPRMNQIIMTYHGLAGGGTIRLDEHELDDYRCVPIARLRPWPHGTGPALRDWLALRGYHPPFVDFGRHLDD